MPRENMPERSAPANVATKGTRNALMFTLLTFTAGGVDALGFLSFGRDVSHISGTTSTLAGGIANLQGDVIYHGVIVIGAFICGAALTGILKAWSRAHLFRSAAALPFAAEGILLFFFVLVDHASSEFPGHLQVAAVLLCFSMGMQNATSSTMSEKRTRTTHVTGISTDIGIAIGTLIHGLCSNRHEIERGLGDFKRVASLYAGFLLGGVSAVIGFHYIGDRVCLPLSALILMLSAFCFGSSDGRHARE